MRAATALRLAAVLPPLLNSHGLCQLHAETPAQVACNWVLHTHTHTLTHTHLTSTLLNKEQIPPEAIITPHMHMHNDQRM